MVQHNIIVIQSSDTDFHPLYLNILGKQSFQHMPKSLILLSVRTKNQCTEAVSEQCQTFRLD